MTATGISFSLLRFEIYCAWDTVDDGGYAQMSGCGIISKLGGYIKRFGYALGPSNSLRASAMSLKLGVLTISRELRNNNSELIIYGSSKILTLLSDDVVIQDKSIESIVLEIRELIRPFGSKIAFEDFTNPYFTQAAKIAKSCQERQRDYKDDT